MVNYLLVISGIIFIKLNILVGFWTRLGIALLSVGNTVSLCFFFYSLLFWSSYICTCLSIIFKEWPDDAYPPWAHGPGYVVSSDIAKAISKRHKKGNLKVRGATILNLFFISLTLIGNYFWNDNLICTSH